MPKKAQLRSIIEGLVVSAKRLVVVQPQVAQTVQLLADFGGTFSFEQ